MCAGSRSEVDPCRPPPSEALRLFEPGFSHAKFFPAQPAGGVPYLESLAGPLPGIHFCLTGGIDVATAPDFLALPNVACVGGSWLTLPNAVARVGPSDHPVVCRLGHDPPGVLKLQLAALRQEVPDHSQLTWFLIRLAFWCVCAICWRAWITLALVLYVGTLGVINLFPTTYDKERQGAPKVTLTAVAAAALLAYVAACAWRPFIDCLRARLREATQPDR